MLYLLNSFENLALLLFNLGLSCAQPEAFGKRICEQAVKNMMQLNIDRDIRAIDN